jgi:hypothetical protein
MLGAGEGKFWVEVGSFYHAHSGELLRRKQGRSALQRRLCTFKDPWASMKKGPGSSIIYIIILQLVHEI